MLQLGPSIHRRPIKLQAYYQAIVPISSLSDLPPQRLLLLKCILEKIAPSPSIQPLDCPPDCTHASVIIQGEVMFYLFFYFFVIFGRLCNCCTGSVLSEARCCISSVLSEAQCSLGPEELRRHCNQINWVQCCLISSALREKWQISESHLWAFLIRRGAICPPEPPLRGVITPWGISGAVFMSLAFVLQSVAHLCFLIRMWEVTPRDN